MPTLSLPYVNIALDSFALLITLIIFATFVSEFSGKNTGSRYFLIFQISVVVALIADIIGWFGEGNPSLSVMTLTANTVTECACRVAIIGFMGYLITSLYASSRSAAWILTIFRILCGLSVLFYIGNAVFGGAFYVNEQGHYVHSENGAMGVMYLLSSILALLTIALMACFAKGAKRINRFAFFIYTIFPIAGNVIDYAVHGLSLTCIGFTISILVMYTSIYLARQKQLEAQRSALMLSQINPHFIYNTLSTIASMCDTSPKQAKYLTIDFSQYLRRNINALTNEALIPFTQEIEHVECYLKIEKARFRERLNVIYSIQCRDFSIPPLTVQPLVENAVKHGVTKKAIGGVIKISTFEEDRHYVIEIIDDGVGFDTENTEMNIGLQTVQSRISAMCRGELTVKSTVGVGTRVRLEIPKKKGRLQ